MRKIASCTWRTVMKVSMESRPSEESSCVTCLLCFVV